MKKHCHICHGPHDPEYHAAAQRVRGALRERIAAVTAAIPAVAKRAADKNEHQIKFGGKHYLPGSVAV